MKTPGFNGTRALTRIEVVAMIVVVGVLSCLLFAWRQRGRAVARSVCCNCNLKQFGVAFAVWGQEHSNSFPMNVSVDAGGSREYIASGETFRHFQILSNELNDPKILVCPEDERRPATSFGAGFGNSNVSYFVGVDADESHPQALLSGDWNITGGRKQPNGVLELTAGQDIAWGSNLHRTFGNVALADGSVQPFSSSALRIAIQYSGLTTNRLAMP